MVFNSLLFAVFLGVVLLLYYRLPHRWQNHLILVGSYVFYAAWDWRFLSLLWISTTVDWWAGLHLDESRSPAYRKRVLFLSCLFNLGFLGVFKYYGFFVDSFVDLAAWFGWHPNIHLLHIVLPIGISFYTFQSMSYTIEVYRKHLGPSKNLLEYATFVAFFPHMVAGPIMRATSLLPQVQKPRVITRAHIVEGLRLMLWGLYKKMVIADNMALIVDPIFSHAGPWTFGETFVGVLAFAFQIYGDFSGYSDIARGTASLMGFELIVNFDLPYLATSPQDFWRRWHISLSTWLRDYLYVSLGGNQKGRVRTYVNLMLTMLLGGLWHGASWTFVCWGAYHGTLLAVHRAIGELRGAPAAARPVWRARLGWFASVVFMFALTLYGWLLFRCHHFDQIAGMTRAIFRGPLDLHALQHLGAVGFYALPLVIVQCVQYAKDDLDFWRQAPVWAQTLFYLFCIYSIFLFGAFRGAAFIYFQF
jgi:D-alanyl-lipoteichoic acid acyltransferase DltB (MBOAT superfamily)